jgi:NDP-sugar pyrophosphorylase family protein
MQKEQGLNMLSDYSFLFFYFIQGCNWLKEKIISEEGKKKQAKVRELQSIADKLNCTMAQLSIGKDKEKKGALILAFK